ncbi:MAG: hypothetical protein IPK35_00160 [Saprospiraceae bacterium]|nr:hypothetical protein [Saprospiraceae bacterium]
MTNKDQQQLGKTLWAIADNLRGAMNADDFRDYMPSLDALITAQAEKIEQLKWHKKGLMQGLFPKMSEP